MRATLLMALLLGASGCIDGCVRGYDPPAEAPDMGTMGPNAAAQYVRGSLTPLFRLTPRSEYGRLSHGGVTLRDRDYQADGVTTSTSMTGSRMIGRACWAAALKAIEPAILNAISELSTS